MKVKLRIWTDDTISKMMRCIKKDNQPIYCVDEGRQRCKERIETHAPHCWKRCKPYNVIVDITRAKK